MYSLVPYPLLTLHRTRGPARLNRFKVMKKPVN